MGRRKGPLRSSDTLTSASDVNWSSPVKSSNSWRVDTPNSYDIVKETPEKHDDGWTTVASRWSAETPEKHSDSRKGKGKGSKGGYSSSKPIRKSADQIKKASPGKTEPCQAETDVPRPKDEIATEISNALQRNSKLERGYFDTMVRQWLHALHGSGGKQAVHDALLMVDFYTSRKEKDSISRWPAYISSLLKKYADNLKQQKIAIQEAGSRLASEAIASEAQAPAPQQLATSTSSAPAKCPWIDRNLKVPDRVQVGQLMDHNLHSEFICRVCLELCQDAIMLPCSHLFCRDCTQSLVDWNATDKPVSCPACRAPFAPSSIDFKAPMSGWLKRWIDGMQVCCVFASKDKLPNAEDPLPPKHAARELCLSCEWIGPAATYSDHLNGSCSVAKHLRELQGERGGRQPGRDDGTSCACEQPSKDFLTSDFGNSQSSQASCSQGPQASEECRNRRDTGDFTVIARYAPDNTQEAVLAIEAGDNVYISRVDASGWAEGTILSSGTKGWLPYSYCSRREHTAQLATEGGLDDYLEVRRGDKVIVYHRDMKGWGWAAKLNGDGTPSPPGWLSDKALSSPF